MIIPPVCSPKPNGKIRICADDQGTKNKYINYLPYPILTFNEITDKIKEASFFSTIDLKDANLQMKIDK